MKTWSLVNPINFLSSYFSNNLDVQLLSYVPQIIFPRNFDFNKATANSILLSNSIITKILNAIKGIKEISFENRSLSKNNERAATN